MDNINELLKLLTAYNIYWLFAIIGTSVFVIQAIMTFLGGFGLEHQGIDSDGIAVDMHTDVNGDGVADVGDLGLAHLKVFSFRSIIAFITFFGWGGLVLDSSDLWRFLFASILGVVMMILTAVMFMLLLRLQNDGQNITPAQIVGESGVVYLTIKGMDKPGIVTVAVVGVTRELEAVAKKEIGTGATVKVVEHITENRYLVEKV